MTEKHCTNGAGKEGQRKCGEGLEGGGSGIGSRKKKLWEYKNSRRCVDVEIKKLDSSPRKLAIKIRLTELADGGSVRLFIGAALSPSGFSTPRPPPVHPNPDPR